MKQSADYKYPIPVSNLFSNLLFVTLLMMVSVMITSCGDQKMQTVTWTEYEPVYMSQEAFVSAVQMEGSRELKQPGKIYFHEGYLFINEVNKGIHIIDNRNPASPSHVGFVNIPANKDLAVKGNRLYADSHSDLLIFDITDMQNAELIARKEGVFEFSATRQRGFPYQTVDHSKGIVVDWKPVRVTEVCEGDCPGMGWNPVIDESLVSFNGAANIGTGGGSTGGVGGSMARFAITGDYLYAVDERRLTAFDITTAEPTLTSQKDVGWAIETIFPNKNNLYVGSESAMYIFDISDPAVPIQVSVYNHLTACDPVVVEGDFAYITLRDGERCPRGVNRLEVLDIEDRTTPKKIATYEMISPYGLGIDGGKLFISEGKHGLKVMNATDPYDIELVRHIKDIKTFDVIPFNNVLMVTGEDGIVQYDYTDINNIKHLSTIPIVSEEE